MSGAINAAGHLSALGGSVLSPAVRASMDEAGTRFIDMATMLAAAEREIARLCEAEGAFVTSGAAAGIAIAIAGCVTRGDGALVAEIPGPAVSRREVVVQAGHLINFGASVAQMVGLGGGMVRAAGSPDAIEAAEVATAFGPDTAAFLWVQSHHTAGNAAIGLEACLEMARRQGVPFVMDCAAEEDLTAYTRLGSDLVIYSGTKAVGAPVSGFIAGREPHVGWCRAQARGIARAMKVGKEQVAGLMTALREYDARDTSAERTRQAALLRRLEDGLAGLPGIGMLRIDDEAGRPIERLGVRLASAEAARRLADALRAGEPAIFTRPHRLGEGIVQFDPRCLLEKDVEAILAAMRRAWAAAP